MPAEVFTLNKDVKCHVRDALKVKVAIFVCVCDRFVAVRDVCDSSPYHLNL